MSSSSSPKTLLVTDLLRVFENYEPSRTRVWEIVRTVHPVHCAALLYLLENVTRKRASVPITIKDDDDDDGDGASADAGERITETRPTLNTTAATVTRQLLPRDDHDDALTARDARGSLTVVGLLRSVRDGVLRGRSLATAERVAVHNLCTDHYARFAENVRWYLLPDEMQGDRNEFDSVAGQRGGVTERFLRYHRSLAGRYCYLNPKSFRYVTRPPCRRVYERPVGGVYTVQPLYSGYRVVINSNDRSTRCYSTYGTLLQGLLYGARFTANATFEAIVLPVDADGRLRSWRYAAAGRRRRCRMAVIVVDVFRVDHRILVQSPFAERAEYIARIDGELVWRPPSADWDTLERRYYDRADLYDPIVGAVARRSDAACADPPLAYRFNLTACYDFLTDTVDRLAGSVTLREFQRVHFNPDMADRRTVCTVYAHDESRYYVCKFDRRRFQFVHCAVLDRLSDVAGGRPKYAGEPVYVLGAKRLPLGVMFLRVYYTASTRRVVAVERKLTTSMYDVPYDDPFL